jgi:putative Mn2+ efflux pump MntP
MKILLATALLSLLGYTYALSFSANNLKGYPLKRSLAAMVTITLASALMMVLGRFLGLMFADTLPELSSKTGSALLLVLAVKTFLRGWKTTPLHRVFDITQTKTLIGLAFAANTDILLMSIATGIMVKPSWFNALVIPVACIVFGHITGKLYSKKAPLTLPNILDLLMAVVLLMAGIYQWIV